jgi:hypothetical protein
LPRRASSNTSFARATHARHRHHTPHIKYVHAKKRNASNGPFISYHTPNAFYVLSFKSRKMLLLMLGLGTRMVKLVFGFKNLMSLT